MTPDFSVSPAKGECSMAYLNQKQVNNLSLTNFLRLTEIPEIALKALCSASKGKVDRDDLHLKVLSVYPIQGL